MKVHFKIVKYIENENKYKMVWLCDSRHLPNDRWTTLIGSKVTCDRCRKIMDNMVSRSLYT